MRGERRSPPLVMILENKMRRVIKEPERERERERMKETERRKESSTKKGEE